MDTSDSTRVGGLPCGCDGAHDDSCWLGAAETIAAEASGRAEKDGRNRLAAMLAALAEAGYLRDLDEDDESDILTVLDILADSQLLGPAVV